MPSRLPFEGDRLGSPAQQTSQSSTYLERRSVLVRPLELGGDPLAAMLVRLEKRDLSLIGAVFWTDTSQGLHGFER